MKKCLFLLILIFFGQTSLAQEFEALLQLRPRYEFRNGFKALLEESQNPASLVSQRTRLILNYENEKLQTKFSLQNVRVWGDVPTMTTADKNGIAVFEAYGEYFLQSNFKFRVGRQVLAYDNERIFGEVNWAQQGQSHDAFLITWFPGADQRLDLGVAINTETENLIEFPYTVNNYKNMQFGWYNLDFVSSGLSFLFANTGYEFQQSFGNRETQYLQTFGSYYVYTKQGFSGDVAIYGQTGNRNDHSVEAFYAGANLNYRLSDNWLTGLGGEYFSGKDMNDTSSGIESFTPLFGTNHGFNGLMDYFFVGNHQNSVGLIDAYAKLTYNHQNLTFSAVPHLFFAEADVYSSRGKEDSFLGTEIDLIANYRFSSDLSLGMGYSQMFGTQSMEILKGGDREEVQNWAWVMISFQPRLFSSQGLPQL